MIVWINGAFGAGKTTTAYELNRRIPNSFVFDPENVGVFIRKNAPEHILKSDFQDHEIWREMNASLLHMISKEFSGVIFVPMTIVNPQYFHEIVSKLKSNGIEVRHFTLLAKRETLLKRLRSRGNGKNSWAAKQIERCVTSLTEDLFKIHIHTDPLTTDEIVTRIAQECKLELLPDHRSLVKKKMDRWITKIKHM